MTRAPLRFLLAVLVLWTGVRAAILLPDWTQELSPLPVAAAAPAPASKAAPLPVLAEAVLPSSPVTGQQVSPQLAERASYPPSRPSLVATVRALPGPQAPPSSRMSPATVSQPLAFTPIPQPPVPATASRWSVSAWLLVRDEGGAALAPGGTLGGSQAGARVTYALGHGVALSGRAYVPLRRTSGAELAAGIDWRPIPPLPVSLLAERRQRLGGEGRNAFALTVHGGTSRALTPRLRFDLYGQAGVVGTVRRDLFIDGSIRIARRIGPVELGAGVWGAAQPGASRLDSGPSLSWRLPLPDTNLRLQADWRFRLAGEARPDSGPALTLAADF